MKSNTYTIVRFIIALLTILVIAGQSHIPQKRLLIHPSQTTRITPDGYIDPIHGRLAKWLDKASYTWSCHAPASGKATNQGCGVSLSWGSTFNNKENSISTACTQTPYSIKKSHLKAEQQCTKRADNQAKQTLPQKPCINPQSDIDNDGLGLEHGQLCQIIPNVMNIPLCKEHSLKNYNNGWGREGGKLCRTKHEASEGSLRLAPHKYTDKDFKGIDFSKYKNLNLKVHYEGRADYLRVYLRNSDPKHTTLEDRNSAKFMTQTVLSEDLTTGLFQIKLSDFNVAEWWTINHPLPRQWSGPELKNITSLGIDHTTPGLHKVRLDTIELTGEWISMEKLLISISIFWSIYLLVETLIRYYTLCKTTKQNCDEIDHLTTHTIQLEFEKNEFREQSITDALTGIFNREGISQFADNLFKSNKQNQALGIMIIDIDHFKRVNDTYGHDAGDTILKSVTDIISTNIRDNDVFGRWGGEEFILICPQTNTHQLMNLAEKLRKVIEFHRFTETLQLQITISIGVTSVTAVDSFSTAFKRADTALYTAKNTRNTISLQV